MDLKELKKQVDKITLELKNKASDELSPLIESQSDELSPLIESQSVLINVILEMSTGILVQNEKIAKQNERLTNTILDLQETIKDLRRQLNTDSHNSSKPPSSDGYKKPNKARSLRKPTGRKPGGQNGHSGANMKVPHEPDEVKKHHPLKRL